VDYVAWARRVNARWIVHQGLDRNATAYLEHLEQTDPDRLRRSCLHAHRLVHERPAQEDPKPWFYAGLFSLADASEKQKFLADHWFVATAINNAEMPDSVASAPETVSAATWEKITRIREALARIRSA